jgi:hypothetical protein
LVVLNLLVDEEPKIMVMDEGASPFGKENYFRLLGFCSPFQTTRKKCIRNESTLRWPSFGILKSFFKILFSSN